MLEWMEEGIVVLWDLNSDFCIRRDGKSQGVYLQNLTLENVSSCGFSLNQNLSLHCHYFPAIRFRELKPMELRVLFSPSHFLDLEDDL